MKIENVKEKMDAISEAQGAISSIESIASYTFSPAVKRALAELKMDLFDILDAEDPMSQPANF
jgi:hypothetical protein